MLNATIQMPLSSIVLRGALADISKPQQNHTNTIISKESKRKIYPLVFLGFKTWPQTCTHTPPHTHIHGLEVSACLCAEMSSQGHPYQCLMIIKRVGCFSPTQRADNKESAGLSEIPLSRPASHPFLPPLPPSLPPPSP